MSTKFDIQQYLDSLPEDTESINVSKRNLDYIPSLERFTKLKKLVCSSNNLTSLPPLNENLRELYCNNNKLTTLPYLNEKLEELDCRNNQLTSLPPLNENLIQLSCNSNKLSTLPPLNKNLRELDCSDNKLSNSQNLNEKLDIFCYDENPICEIIGESFTINEAKHKIKTLNKFRHLYYSLKFKKQFRDLLWLRIREPKIRKQFNPIHLENLGEDTDFDEFLNHW